MPICPRCLGSGSYRVNQYIRMDICDMCDGLREVSSMLYAEYFVAHPRAVRPSPLLEDETSGITLVPCPRCTKEKVFDECDLCDGTKLVSPITYARWKMISKKD